MLNLYTIFLHLDSILVPTPMGELAALFYTPYLLKLLTIFSWITSEKIIRSMISSVMKCFFFFSFGMFFLKKDWYNISIYISFIRYTGGGNQAQPPLLWGQLKERLIAWTKLGLLRPWLVESSVIVCLSIL